MDATVCCRDCLRRSWLLERLAGHLARRRGELERLLALPDRELIAELGGRTRAAIDAEYAALSPHDTDRMLAANAAAGVRARCCHDDGFPGHLRELGPAGPAALFEWGSGPGLEEALGPVAVAVVGTRRATAYGRAVAERLGSELGASGVCVISGLAFGIDAAAHQGAVSGGGRTVAVLAGGPDRPQPAGHRRLHGEVGRAGVVISEFGVGARGWPWRFASRNRIIAGLAQATVVVEAAAGSGSLITVRAAERLGRPIGVVPGPVTSPQSGATNALLVSATAGTEPVAQTRVHAVRGAQDVLELVLGAGAPRVVAAPRPRLDAQESELLDRIHAGLTNLAGIEPEWLGALSGLEFKGCIRHGPGGAIVVTDPAGGAG